MPRHYTSARGAMVLRPPRPLLAITGAALLILTACSPEAPTAAPAAHIVANGSAAANEVSVCHAPNATPSIIEVAGAALHAHLAHGDYVTTLRVSHDDAPADDGVHFRRISDALHEARTGRLSRGELVDAACRITIQVSAGSYAGTTGDASGHVESLPLIVDVPDLTLRGAMTMEIDGYGRATGVAVGNTETVIAPVTAMPVVAGVSTPILVANGHPGGSAGNGLIMEGFVLVNGPNPPVSGSGQGVLALRVNDIVIRGNRFEGGFTESIDLRASRGDVLQNHLSGTAGSCDICLAAPGRYRAIGNRLLSGGIPGITTSAVVGLPVPAGIEPYQLPATAEVWSEVRNNEVRDHLRTPVGVGIRVETVGTMAPNVHNTVNSIIRDNLLVNNRFGIIIHAGFPVNGTALRGNANVTLGGNSIQQVCQTKVLVTLSRHQRTLGLNLTLPYLLNSTYSVGLNGDVAWDDVWFDHPAGLGNQLIVDGAAVANGIRQFYSVAGCPGA
jgi:hypothetical protein